MKTTPTRHVPSFPAGGASFARFLAALLLLGLTGLAPRLSAQGVVPERFSFQGYMEDGNGVALGASTPANFTVAFRIYPTATGGTTALWAEQQVVTFDKGNYSVILGQGSQIGTEAHGDLSAVVTTATSSELYVQTTVTINGNPVPILPRLRLLPAMFSFLAKKSLNADLATRANSAARADTTTWAANATNATFANQAAAAIQAQTAGFASVAGVAQTVSIVNGSVIGAGTVPQTALAPAVVTSLTGPVADSRLSANVALRGSANTFTGPQTVNGNMTITGNATINTELKLGSTGQYSAVGGFAGFAIVHGVLPGLANNGDPGAKASGPGWSAERVPNSVNFWKVTFTSPFAGSATIVTSWCLRGRTVPITGNSSPGIVAINSGESFIVYGAALADNSLALDTSFIAIGPR